MPYPSQHSCRIKEPSLFEPGSFRTLHTKTSGLTIIVGTLKATGKGALQAFRYNRKIWTRDRASKHCADRNGRFDAASTKKNTDLQIDHKFMHIVFSKTKKTGEWNGWKTQEAIEEHARITDELRNRGYAMQEKTALDRESKQNEKTIVKVTPETLAFSLKTKALNLEDKKLFVCLLSLEGIERDSNYVYVDVDKSNEKDKLVLVIKLEDRDEKLEKKILDQMPEDYRDNIEFSYSIEKPKTTYIPLFSLCLNFKDLRIVKLGEKVEQQNI